MNSSKKKQKKKKKKTNIYKNKTNKDDGNSKYQFIKQQTLLNKFIKDPDVNSNIEYFAGILFTGKIKKIYKSGLNGEKITEMDDKEDKHYSELGLEFFKQMLLYNMIFYYFQETEDGDVYPYIPKENGLIGVMETQNGLLPGWFRYGTKIIEKEPNPYVKIHMLETPDMKQLHFNSKLQPLLKIDQQIDALINNAIELEFHKVDPKYYLTETYPPIKGQETKLALDQIIEYYKDNQSCEKNQTKINPNEYFTVDTDLMQHYKTQMLEDAFDNQETQVQEDISMGLKMDQYLQKYGIPFFKHRKVLTYNMYYPSKTHEVMKFGPSIRPKHITFKEPNLNLLNKLEQMKVDKVNKTFGLQRIGNLDRTKMGSTIMIKTLNETINSYSERVGNLLTLAYRHKLESTKNIEELESFQYIRLDPSLQIPDLIQKELLKMAGKNPDLINEILRKTINIELDILKKFGNQPQQQQRDQWGKEKEEWKNEKVSEQESIIGKKQQLLLQKLQTKKNADLEKSGNDKQVEKEKKGRGKKRKKKV
jgi:hypothetical protein